MWLGGYGVRKDSGIESWVVVVEGGISREIWRGTLLYEVEFFGEEGFVGEV